MYKIPSSGKAREALRQKGQFWTPDWIAEAMVAYVLTGNTLFDPAVGAGAFFRAAKAIAREKGLSPLALSGMDIDPTVIEQAVERGLTRDDLAGVTIGDFIFQPPREKLSAIVANPPYIRHHRLSPTTKEFLKQVSMHTIGKALDGRAGLHVYFLIRALTLLDDMGRLAFIMPADTCEGRFANDLWRWVTAKYRLEAVVTFTPDASPFPNVDTNPLIFYIRKAPPRESFLWARCSEPHTAALTMWVRSGFEMTPDSGLTVLRRELSEGLSTGLSRAPVSSGLGGYVLGDFVHVVRGVATGANDFFCMTAEQVQRTGIPEGYFVRAVCRTKDVPGEEVTQETLDALEAKGRPTFLLALGGDPLENYPENVKKYLAKGELLGLPKRPLLSRRKPWYKAESRIAPPFLFTYLGRRNSRFIRNTARVVPLTCFLCVYPARAHEEHGVWNIVSHPDTVANLPLVGKSYGNGAIKVEPRALEMLPVPQHVVEQSGIHRRR